MKVVKKINNNVAIGIDGNNREVVLFGKGIGFKETPYELTDMSKVDRTFYDVDERYFKLFEEIDLDLFNLVGTMVDIIKSKLPGDWDSRLTFTLSDHLHFCLRRMEMGMKVGFPYSFEIEAEFPEFNKYAKWIVHNINKKYNVVLEKGEITCVAMHLISAHEGREKQSVETVSDKTSRILNSIIKIIENDFETSIDRSTLNYYRFRYHIQYYVKRKENNEEMMDGNQDLLDSMKKSYPDAYQCVLHIEEYLNHEYKGMCSKDEMLYLMVHINRLISKEDCNRKGITPGK